jgi:recombination protein RecT
MTSTMPGTAMAARSPREQLKAELARFAPSFATMLPKGYAPDRLITGALIAVQNEPKLLECGPISVATALARIARWGLDPGETAHLIPFGKSCTAVADYKGLIRLMIRAGARKVEAHEVREGDTFHYEYGTEPVLRHQPAGSRSGKILAAYAIAWMRTGATIFEVMTADEIDTVRQEKSLSWKKGPLPSWYARKTVVRRLAKYCDQTPELAAVQREDETRLSTEEIPANLLDSLRPSHVTEDGEILPEPAA